MRRHWNYLKYVLRHKWFVFREGCKLGVPLLILICHDWDKFLPDEWFPYARTFYAPNGEKRYAESIEFAQAWAKHQQRNKHHWQWWLMVMMPDHNCAVPIQKYYPCVVWDRGQAQAFVKSEKVSGTYTELHDIPPYHTLHPDPMPDVYRREMLADWRGAGLALGFPDTAAWYAKNRDKMILHDETRAWIEAQLSIDNRQSKDAEAQP